MNAVSIVSPIAPPSTRGSRRTSTRREVVLPCQAVRERDITLIADQTLDVSVDGLLLPVTAPILTGEAIIVSFQIPGAWIDAEAVVTRVVHGRRPEDEGLAVGAIFDVISPASRAALAGFLHGRPPPLPRRGPLARLRRGQEAPRLADHALMQAPVIVPSPRPGAVVEIGDDAEEITEAEALDAQKVLCALVGAWRDLAAAAQ
jgi:hypothetical protein